MEEKIEENLKTKKKTTHVGNGAGWLERRAERLVNVSCRPVYVKNNCTVKSAANSAVKETPTYDN